ncbi:MAG: NAD(P)/FAD-dependent oxidoreductase [Magnetococcus sp. DMHC-6]
MLQKWDVLIIGAGASGLMCAQRAAKRGRRVVVVDHGQEVGKKIRISGGGRCNFTHLQAQPKYYLGNDPLFCRFALRAFRPEDFMALLKKYGVHTQEKSPGQMFCAQSSRQIVDVLLEECRQGGVVFQMGTMVQRVQKKAGAFIVQTSQGEWQGNALVVATGGRSWPKIGATGLGYALAEQFGVRVVPQRPALVPLTCDAQTLHFIKPLIGIALPAQARSEQGCFNDGLLFTHRGLSGPVILQISSYWREGEKITLNLAPQIEIYSALKNAKNNLPRHLVGSALSQWLPKRLAQAIVEQIGVGSRLAETSDKTLRQVANAVNHWQMTPSGTEGYRTAEVTLGGVDTQDLFPKNMQCKQVPGLYFIGESVDITGQLGGFNLQWAWSSGYVAGQSV